MQTVLFFLITGLLAGFMLRRHPGLLHRADQASSLAVYLLLFFLGLSAGLQPEILSAMGPSGLHALILSLAATAGSILLVWPLYPLLFKNKKNPRTEKKHGQP
ncbi:lysine exporter LysO-like protein [Desulfobotulus alkaliphilus]|uniref:Lysine exporter LysO-like protein n=1 Tax=Desulfobotulus alkaliphilus TaxID=622671 RepID=A0A562RT03_9BACT|nr:LysO family transporter [Desulfobotulus alkaliphilus]TWI71684.1 lysine exporter LysO-like protein [Desulfobotulus alkaliphilus]